MSNHDTMIGRDCVVLVKGDTHHVTIDPNMANQGWAGGQGVRWVPGLCGERTVTYSDGTYGGILIYGSDELADRHSSLTRNQVVYRTATLMYGGALISTRTYERYTYASRLANMPVPLVYGPNDTLYLSARGLFTKEDEMTLVGHPHAPALLAGVVAMAPNAMMNGFMVIQTRM